MNRHSQELSFTWGDGEALSNSLFAGGGAFGTLIVPSGSDLITKTIQFVAHSPDGNYDDADLLSTPITISAAGAYSLSSDQIAEVGAVRDLKLKADSNISGSAECTLLWKS